MSKKLQLTIPTPCHENWDAMTQVEKGKFCGSCQKQVVDFSNMSDRQVAEFFKKPSTGSVCGRFMNDQLDRNIEIPKKRIPWVKYFFQIAIPAFLVSIKLSAQTTKGKIKVNTVTTDTTRRPVYDDLKTLGMVARPMDIKPFMGDTVVVPVKQPVTVKGEIKIPVCNEPRDTFDTRVTMGVIAMPYDPPVIDNSLVKGKVIDENGNALPFATIMVKGTKNAVASNAAGEFRMKLTANTGQVVLVASYVGYEIKELPFDRANHPDLVVLQLQRSQYHLVGELVVTRKPEPKKEIKNVPLMPDATEMINGRVTNERGEPMPGASIKIIGNNRSTHADNNGHFLIKANKGEKLIVSSSGSESEKVNITDMNTISIVLKTITISCGGYPKKEIKNVPLMPAVIKDATTGAFKVFPNPVTTGSDITIEWKETEEGYYTIQLFDQSGKQTQQQEIWIDTEARMLSIDIPSVAAGSYFLVLTNKKTGKKYSEKIIIQ